MKKIVLALIMILTFSMNVYAEECRDWEIEDANEALKDLTFNLEYLKDGLLAPNGNMSESYFEINFPNLPEGYNIIIETSLGPKLIETKDDRVPSEGTVAKVEVYMNTCDTVLKSFEIKVPSYKLNCTLENNCDENIWFDGTYENKVTPPTKEKESPLNIILLIVLVGLIIVMIGLIFFVIRKRRLDAQDL